MIKTIYKNIFVVAVLSTFLEIVSVLVDGLVIGNYYGNRCFTAFGLVSPMLFAFTTVSTSISSGSQNLTGEALGRGNRKKANEIFMSTLAMSISAAVVFSLLIFAFSEKISCFLCSNGDKELISDMIEYLHGYILGVPGIVFLVISLPFVQLDGKKNYAKLSVITYTLADILLDFLAAYFFRQSVFYIGFASTLSVYLADIFIIFHFMKSDNMFKISLFDIRISDFGGILKNGFPKALGHISWTVMMVIMNLLVVKYGGADAVTAFSLTMSFYNFMIVNTTANCSAVAMMTATYAAESDIKALKTILRYGMRCTFFGNLIIGIIIFIFAGPIASLYADGNITVIACATVGIRFMVFRVLNCVCDILRCVFLAMKRLVLSEIVYVSTSFFGLVITALLFAPIFGMNGIWLAFVLSDVIITLILYFVFSVRKGHVIPRAEDYISFPEMGLNTEFDNIYFEISSKDDIIYASKQVESLCKAHNEDNKIGLYSALAVEELGMNVINHGFRGKMDEKSFLNIRAFYRNDSLILSFKDNADAFDPTKYMYYFDKKNISHKHLGINMIMKMAKNVKYTYTYGLNCIFVEI